MKKTLILGASLFLIMAFIGLLGTNPNTSGLDKELSQIKKVYTELDTAWENVSDLGTDLGKESLKPNEGLAYLQP